MELDMSNILKYVPTILNFAQGFMSDKTGMIKIKKDIELIVYHMDFNNRLLLDLMKEQNNEKFLEYNNEFLRIKAEIEQRYKDRIEHLETVKNGAKEGQQK